MANRALQQKILKQKRRGRYKRLSGGDTDTVVRLGPVPFDEDANGNTTSKAAVVVTVRVVKFSRQVINNAPNGKPYRALWKETKAFLDNYHDMIDSINRVEQP